MKVIRRIISSAIPILLLLFIQGCVIYFRDRVVHEPPLAKNVPRIVKGQTTKVEVFEWFGVPDMLIDGVEITLFPESPMGQKRAKIREMWIKYKEEVQKHENAFKKSKYWYGPPSSIDPDWPEKAARLQPYSSIDDEHIALIFLESEIRLKGKINWYLVRCTGHTNATYYENRLLIFIDKKTNIVDEFAYREGFKVD